MREWCLFGLGFTSDLGRDKKRNWSERILCMNNNQLRDVGDGCCAVDLFCGCGGLTAGLKMAGFKVLGAVEVDPLAAQNYTANHRRVKLWESDVRSIEVGKFAATLGLSYGRLDLLAGCPPCQGFSSMRTKNGAIRVDDPRNDLLFEFLRFVKGLLPRAVMLENVPGLADDMRFVRVLSSYGANRICW